MMLFNRVSNKTVLTSIATRIRNRFRYGLAMQEVLDRLAATVGLVIYPYYLVHEKLQSGAKPEFPDSDDVYHIRYLNEADMVLLAEHGAQKKSTAELVEILRSGSRSLGFFVNAKLAGYTWFRLDCTPIPLWRSDLFRLEHDEAYLFNAYVLPAYRGRRLAPCVRYRAYEELQSIGIHSLYSITLAFNASSRRFKQKLQAKEVELRLLIGIKRWKAFDVRLRAFDDQIRAPRFRSLGRLRLRNPSPTP